jgi:hypothetical protein
MPLFKRKGKGTKKISKRTEKDTKKSTKKRVKTTEPDTKKYTKTRTNLQTTNTHSNSEPSNVFNNNRVINEIDTENKTININFKTSAAQLSPIDLYSEYYVFKFKDITQFKNNSQKNKHETNYIKLLNTHPYKYLNVYTNNILNIINDKSDEIKKNIGDFYEIFARKLTSISLLIYVIKEFSKQNIFKNENLNNYINKIEPLLIKFKNDNIKFDNYENIIYFTIYLIKDYLKSVYYLLKILSLQVKNNITIYNYIFNYTIKYSKNVDLGLKNSPEYQNLQTKLPIQIPTVIGELTTRIELILLAQFMTIYYEKSQIKILKNNIHCLIIHKITILFDNLIGNYIDKNFDLLHENINILRENIDDLDKNIGLLLPKFKNDNITNRARTQVVTKQRPGALHRHKVVNVKNCKTLITPIDIPKDFNINEYYTFNTIKYNQICNIELKTFNININNTNFNNIRGDFNYALQAARKAELKRAQESLERRKLEKTVLESTLKELQKKLTKKKSGVKGRTIKRRAQRPTITLPNYKPTNTTDTQARTSQSSTSLNINEALFEQQPSNSPKAQPGSNTKKPSATKQTPTVVQAGNNNQKGVKKPSTTSQNSIDMGELEELLQYMDN